MMFSEQMVFTIFVEVVLKIVIFVEVVLKMVVFFRGGSENSNLCRGGSQNKSLFIYIYVTYDFLGGYFGTNIIYDSNK